MKKVEKNKEIRTGIYVQKSAGVTTAGDGLAPQGDKSPVTLTKKQQKQQHNKSETGSRLKPGGSTASKLFAVKTPATSCSGGLVATHGPSASGVCSEVGKPLISGDGKTKDIPGPAITPNATEVNPLPKGKILRSRGSTKDIPGMPSASSTPGNKPHHTGGQRSRAPSKSSYKERRNAERTLKFIGTIPENSRTAQQKNKVSWARKILANAERLDRDFTSKRQRSMEEPVPVPKRPKGNIGTPTNLSGGTTPKTFSDALKGKIVIAVINKSDPDGTISSEQWQLVKMKLSASFLSLMRANPGTPPITSDGGWHQGHVKLVACEDQRSRDLFTLAIRSLGEVWPGASLEVVAKEDIPSRPRTRTWIPAEPSSLDDIIQIIKLSNPEIPTHNWKVAKLDEQRGLYRCALIVINKESLVHLAKTQGVIRYGFESITLRVYKKDEIEAGVIPPHPSLSEKVHDSESSVSSPLEAGKITFPSMDGEEDDVSDSSSLETKTPTNLIIGEQLVMETDDSLKGSPDEDELLGSSSGMEDLDNTVVEVSLPDCSNHAAVSSD